MSSEIKIKVNERLWPVTSSPDTPLLYILSTNYSCRAAIRVRSGTMRSCSSSLTAFERVHA